MRKSFNPGKKDGVTLEEAETYGLYFVLTLCLINCLTDRRLAGINDYKVNFYMQLKKMKCLDLKAYIPT